MPYAKQAWVDNVTPVDAAHMLFIENGIEAQVDAASVTAAGGNLVETRLLAADPYPTFRIYGSGTLQWGPGGAGAFDTQIERNGAGSLYTVSTLQVGSFIVGGEIIDAGGTWFIDGSGNHQWGPGDWSRDTNLYRYTVDTLATDDSLLVDASNTGKKLYFGTFDTNLYRSAAGTLKTDGSLIVTAKSGYNPGLRIAGAAGYEHAFQLFKNNTDTQPTLLFSPDGTIQWGPGTGMDTSLYRDGVNRLGTSGRFAATGLDCYSTINVISAGAILTGVAGGGDTAYRFTMGNDGAMFFGPGNATADTNLYRLSANILATDDEMVATQFRSQAGATTQIGLLSDGKLYFGNALDTNLYRKQAFQLKTDGAFFARDAVVVDHGGTGEKLFFGSALDTNLYRGGADYLVTDDVFNAPQITARPTGGQVGFFHNPVSGANYVMYVNVQGETNPRFTMDGSGGHNWGPGGSTARDTNLYRWTTGGYLKTDGNMLVAKGLWVNHDDGAGNKINFGSAGDTNLYRAGAASLAVTGTLYVPSVDPANVTSRSGLQLNFYGIKIAYLEIGAADSGGSGYRMVRVLN